MTISSRYRAYSLASAFQPIFSLCHRRTVGYEALLRPARDDRALAPLDVIARAAERDEGRLLDTLCQTLHIENFAQQMPPTRWLFLNLDPSTITRRWYDDGQLLETLKAAGMAPEQVVIELLEGQIADEPALLDAIQFFRSAGALVALDDFGVGHSNFDRLWRLTPDIIKLDRALIAEAEQHRNSRLRRVLPNLVSLIHEAGSLVLCEGVETEAQALVAMEADVDFVQGFYFGFPDARIETEPEQGLARLSRLSCRHAAATAAAESTEHRLLEVYSQRFRQAVDALVAGQSFSAAGRRLMALPRTARLYWLGENGEEIDHIAGAAVADSRRAAPILDSTGGIWRRRPYFESAVYEPGTLQISRPYLSSTGGYMCITLSIASASRPHHVFCCDVMA